MSCQPMDERIHAYLDDELDATERTDFEAHIAACPDCRTHLSELGYAIQKLSQAEWLKAPTGFTESLMDRLQAEAPPKRDWRVPIMKWSGIAASVLLVFGLGLYAATPDQFALQAEDTQGLVVADGKVIVPEGSVYTGDLVIQNGDVEVRGKVNGNVTALNGRVVRMAGADISGETAEVDEAMEKLVYYGKQLWQEVTEWSR
ncbi:MAG TPA: zf-HC2 domain-containing protein [Bacilli bacterium]|nr:zf-HC2 domain-containing protein [Bacilli bacterium]